MEDASIVNQKGRLGLEQTASVLGAVRDLGDDIIQSENRDSADESTAQGVVICKELTNVADECRIMRAIVRVPGFKRLYC